MLLRLVPYALGVGASRFVFVDSLLSFGEGGTTTSGSLVAFLFFLCLWALAAAFSPDVFGRLMTRKRAVPTAAAACVIGLGLLLGTGVSSLAPYLGALACSWGCLALWLAWLACLTALPNRSAVVAVVAGWGAAALLSMAGYLVGMPAVALGMAFAVASALLYFTQGDDVDEELPATIDRFSTDIGFHVVKPSAALIVSVCSLMFALSLSYHVSTRAFFLEHVVPAGQYLEDVLAVVVLIAITGLCKRVGIITLCRVVIPCVALAYFAYGVVPPDLQLLCCLIGGIGAKAAQPFLWLLLVRVASDTKDKGVSLFSWTFIGLAGGQLCALLIVEYLRTIAYDGAAMLQFALLVVVLVVVLFILPSGWSYVEENRLVPLSREEVVALACERVAGEGGLTDREADVLKLLAQGFSQAAISERLFIGAGTVHTHRAHIYQKLDVHSRQELIDLVQRRADALSQ